MLYAILKDTSLSCKGTVICLNILTARCSFAVGVSKVCGVCIVPRQSSHCFMLQLFLLIRL